jgi:predicted transcriptional regulator
MKLKEKNLAIDLRKKGWSMNEIKKELGVAKSSVSLWVKKIKLTKNQKQKLSNNGIKKEIIEKRRETRLKNENSKRQIIVDRAKGEINNLSLQELKIIGATLYWAEGGKTQRGLVRVSNGDCKVIEVMMEFLRKICEVPEEKFRGHIHIHPHLDIKKAENYWSSISGIPLKQFYKTYSKQNKSSQNKKDSLPFGTFDIYVCNTELFLKIKGWIEGIYKNIINMPR